MRHNEKVESRKKYVVKVGKFKKVWPKLKLIKVIPNSTHLTLLTITSHFNAVLENTFNPLPPPPKNG